MQKSNHIGDCEALNVIADLLKVEESGGFLQVVYLHLRSPLIYRLIQFKNKGPKESVSCKTQREHRPELIMLTKYVPVRNAP